jgi:hypothetical protein
MRAPSAVIAAAAFAAGCGFTWSTPNDQRDMAPASPDLIEVPGPPTGLLATPKYDAVELVWTASTDPVDDYLVQIKGSQHSRLVDAVVSGTSTTIAVPPVYAGESYLKDITFTVVARKNGVASPPTAPVLARPCSWLACNIHAPKAPTLYSISVGAAITNGFIVAGIGTPPEVGVQRSIDHGETWTEIHIPGLMVATDLAVHDRTVVVMTNGGKIFTSIDEGATFTETASGKALGGVLWDGTRFISVAQSQVHTSPDGITWTTTTAAATTTPYTAPGGWAFGNGKFVGTSEYPVFPNRVYLSADGINWSNTTMPGWIVSKFPVMFADGLFVASGLYSLYTSGDGLTWTSRMSRGGFRGRYVDGRYVYLSGVLTSIDRQLISADGITWREEQSQPNAYDIAFDGTVFAWIPNQGPISVGTKR